MKSWRESASIIIAAKNGQKYHATQSQYNYNLLFLKRKKEAKFSGAYVFPGGVIEIADAHLKWQNLYKNYGFNENSFKSLFPNTKSRPHIFNSRENELPREISLRIAAIRETFEECGVLLCEQSSEISDKAHHFPISSDDLEFWQKEVHGDPNEFFNMCEQLHCWPNLWALHEWTNWLSPTLFPAARRFNTAFFFATMTQIPSSKLDFSEVEEILWATPEYVKKSLIDYLPPPQLYEVNILEKYKNIDDLYKYALIKSRKGVQLYFPVVTELSDGKAILLPGDQMYPETVNLYEQEVVDKSNLTIKQFNEMSGAVNRLEFSNEGNKSLQIRTSMASKL
ncbi:nucleoside diphosphate-linked moiety X motif 19-like [Copidosoma floridanum]|uniref:nucleoside diphosphate-linked moiety X motif 19-like n=1 Tax=Copidosoma floridanum TaxID=29053 RepID=UPI0006C9DDB4|nr:nucleoside diphosphate-linked moiety X motif 19-like [Copidosoma floridanum]